MILSAYRFAGDPAELLERHQRMLDLYPPAASTCTSRSPTTAA